MKTYDPIQRFDMGGTALGEMRETDGGDWVKLEDVKDLLMKLDEAFLIGIERGQSDGNCNCAACQARIVLSLP